MTISAAALLLVLWLKNGGMSGNNAVLTLGLIIIGILAAVALGRKRR